MKLIFAALMAVFVTFSAQADDRMIISYPLGQLLLVMDFDNDGDRDEVWACPATRLYAIISTDGNESPSTTVRLTGDCVLLPEPVPPPMRPCNPDGPDIGPCTPNEPPPPPPVRPCNTDGPDIGPCLPQKPGDYQPPHPYDSK